MRNFVAIGTIKLWKVPIYVNNWVLKKINIDLHTKIHFCSSLFIGIEQEITLKNLDKIKDIGLQF